VTEGDRDRRRRFDGLFRDYSADIVAYCSWRAGSPSDAQDAVADVFLTAWRRLDDVPDGDAARVWLYATARRVISNQRRSNRRRVALHDRLALETASAPQHAPAPDREATLVREALRRLRPRDREVLLLAEWEGLEPSQISAVVGCHPVTARGRLHRARRRFRIVFEELMRGSGERTRSDTSEEGPASLLSMQPVPVTPHATGQFPKGGS
jgi:RNA polymerase sigma factor (sigma-70 family)